MLNSDQEYLINVIKRNWERVDNESRPQGLWIAEHEPLDQEVDSLTTDVIRCWYLSKDGLKKHSAWDYVNYLTIHSGKYWRSSIYSPESTNSGIGKY